MSSKGYCHFNEDGKKREFSISLFDKELMIQQDPSSETLGHGAVVWDASVIFVKYMEKNAKSFDPKKLSGQTVLELGSGCGLAGIGYMLRGASVTATDLESVVKSLTHRNFQSVFNQAVSEENQMSGITIKRPIITPIDWTKRDKFIPLHTSDISKEDQVFDVILLTDCVFSALLVEDLVQTILKFSGPKTTVICCHEIRDEDANAAFIKRLSDYFQIKKVQKSKYDPEFVNDQVEILIGKQNREKKKHVK